MAQAEGDAFIVLLGDIVDQGDRPSLIAVRSTLTNLGWDGKVFTVIGNHDIFADGWTNYKELNGPSYYAFNVGNSKFIAMDTGDGTLGSDQMTWLESEVQNDRPQNLFFLSHYMPVVPGIQTYLKFPDEEEALSLMKLAVDHGVSAWLGGHYHSYLQSTIDGVLYVVAGGGGSTRMAPVYDFFFVQVTVAGSQVSAVMHKVN
jgi:predicted phosphodiesterase